MTNSGNVNEVMPKNRTEYKNAFYRNKIQQNPEFYALEKIRVREYNKAKYHNDPEYAEKVKANRRAYYAKNKLAKAI